MKKIIAPILIVFIILIGYGGVKFYLHNQITQDLDDLIMQAKPFVSIEYQNVSTNLLKSEIEISNVVIRPMLTPEPISIDAIKFTGADLFAKRNYGLTDFKLNSTKTRKIQIQGLTLDLNSPLLSNYIAPAPTKQNILFENNPNLLKQLGYDTLKINFTFTFEPSPDQNKWVLRFTHQQEEMFQLTGEATLTTQSPINTDTGITSTLYNYQLLHLKSGFLIYQDKSLLPRLYAVSAQEENKPIEIIQQETYQDLLDKLNQDKILLNESSLEVIQAFIKNPNQIKLIIAPPEPVKLDSLSQLYFYNPSLLPERLNVSLSNTN